MLLATKTLGATGGAVAGAAVGVGIAVGVGAGVTGVAYALAVGLVDGAEPATPVVPQAARNIGAMSVSSSLLAMCLPRSKEGAEGAGDLPLPRGWKPPFGVACLQESCSRARYSTHGDL